MRRFIAYLYVYFLLCFCQRYTSAMSPNTKVHLLYNFIRSSLTHTWIQSPLCPPSNQYPFPHVQPLSWFLTMQNCCTFKKLYVKESHSVYPRVQALFHSTMWYEVHPYCCMLLKTIHSNWHIVFYCVNILWLICSFYWWWIFGKFSMWSYC